MRGLILLFRFMTRFPVPGKENFDMERLGKGMKFFPIVGLVIGLINLGVGYILNRIVPGNENIIAILLITLNVIFTGGLHLDGLADTFDGIFSYRSKQKMLEIMKDSRVGTNGVLILICYFMFHIVFLSADANKLSLTQGGIMLIIPVLSRINPVINCTFEKYARAVGLGKTFVDNTDIKDLSISYIFELLFIFVVSKFLQISMIKLLIVLHISMVASFLFGKLMSKKIGGVTGDTLGALLELSVIFNLVLIYFVF